MVVHHPEGSWEKLYPLVFNDVRTHRKNQCCSLGHKSLLAFPQMLVYFKTGPCNGPFTFCEEKLYLQLYLLFSKSRVFFFLLKL